MGEIQGAKTSTERGHAFGDCYFLGDPDEDTQWGGDCGRERSDNTGHREKLKGEMMGPLQGEAEEWERLANEFPLN